MRRLRVTRRHVALDESDEYLDAWQAVRAAAAAAGASAWIFRGSAHEDQFLEFIEWKEGQGDPVEVDTVAAALERLDAFAPARQSDEWEEAT